MSLPPEPFTFVGAPTPRKEDPMRKYLPSRETAKAVCAAVVTACAYLVGVFPKDASLVDGFAALTGLQWLGLVLFLGGAYGLTYRVSNADR